MANSTFFLGKPISINCVTNGDGGGCTGLVFFGLGGRLLLLLSADRARLLVVGITSSSLSLSEDSDSSDLCALDAVRYCVTMRAAPYVNEIFNTIKRINYCQNITPYYTKGCIQNCINLPFKIIVNQMALQS